MNAAGPDDAGITFVNQPDAPPPEDEPRRRSTRGAS